MPDWLPASRTPSSVSSPAAPGPALGKAKSKALFLLKHLVSSSGSVRLSLKNFSSSVLTLSTWEGRVVLLRGLLRGTDGQRCHPVLQPHPTAGGPGGPDHGHAAVGVLTEGLPSHSDPRLPPPVAPAGCSEHLS